jgi:hypothetical protein
MNWPATSRVAHLPPEHPLWYQCDAVTCESPQKIDIEEPLMLFHITQVHTPETCPRDEGGSNTLYNPNVPGLKLIGRYGANAQHVLFYIVEADDVNAIQKFLWPGFKRCTATITPVSEVPVPKD